MMKLHTRYWMNVGILSVMQTERQEWLFVYDDYGRLIAYVAGVDGEKQLVYSVQVHKNEARESIYTEKVLQMMKTDFLYMINLAI